jgi:hypothetical protein
MSGHVDAGQGLHMRLLVGKVSIFAEFEVISIYATCATPLRHPPRFFWLNKIKYLPKKVEKRSFKICD